MASVGRGLSIRGHFSTRLSAWQVFSLAAVLFRVENPKTDAVTLRFKGQKLLSNAEFLTCDGQGPFVELNGVID